MILVLLIIMEICSVLSSKWIILLLILCIINELIKLSINNYKNFYKYKIWIILDFRFMWCN